MLGAMFAGKRLHCAIDRDRSVVAFKLERVLSQWVVKVKVDVEVSSEATLARREGPQSRAVPFPGEGKPLSFLRLRCFLRITTCDLMLASVLHRSRCQLQAHQSWLAAFQLSRTWPLPVRGLNGSPERFAAQCADNQRAQSVRTFSSTTTRNAKQGAKRLPYKRVKVGSSDRTLVEPHLSPTEHRLLDFVEAIENVDIKAVITRYRALHDNPSDKQVLEREHVWRLTQCLHEALRREKRSARDSSRRQERRRESEELVEFAEQLVKDIKRDRLPPDHRSHVHLLAIFKESGVRDAGVRFWGWLRSQDERYVNADIYGVAIELLATDGVALPELEGLFQEALTRFPDNFHAYHLSPEAIVPDREQPTTVKGLSMTLLQGILTARVLNGDTRNAYLALDTGLRLYPTQLPSRFFDALLAERPLVEAYTVLAMACRAGIVLSLDSTRRVLTALRNSSDQSTPSVHIYALRSMLSVVYMHLGAGGYTIGNNVNEVLLSMTHIQRLNGIAKLESNERKQVVDSTLEIIRRTMELFSRYGATPGVSAFNSIIANVAGFGQSKQVIDIALKDARSLGLAPNLVTRRSILSAAGYLRDADLLKKSWADLEQARRESGERPDASDFHLLVKAAKLCNQGRWAEQICRKSALHLPEMQRSSLYERLSSQSHFRDADPSTEPGTLDLPHLLSEMEKVQADLSLIDERTKDRPKYQDFSAQDLHMTLLLEDRVETPQEADLRKIYDELTSEPGQPTPTSQDTSVAETKSYAISTTGLSVGKLRYENWKSVNYLLELADKNDKQYSVSVDEAIAAGRAPPQRPSGLVIEDYGSSRSYGLSDVAREEKTAADIGVPQRVMEPREIEHLREKVLRLRCRLPEA